jgi:hypothetical protein
MNAQKKASKKVATGKALAIGAGALALSAAAYYLLGPRGKANRKKVKDWTAHMKRDIVKRLGTVKNLTKEAYTTAVEEVARKYKDDISKRELGDVLREVKGHWKNIQGGRTPKRKTAKSASKKRGQRRVKRS